MEKSYQVQKCPRHGGGNGKTIFFALRACENSFRAVSAMAHDVSRCPGRAQQRERGKTTSDELCKRGVSRIFALPAQNFIKKKFLPPPSPPFST
jgi:hypothetical protein